MKTTRSDQIHKRIERIKTELDAIDDMRPGSLTEQFKDHDAQRGAYYQLIIGRAREPEPTMFPATSCVTFGASLPTINDSKR
jgi:hypothetical protein